MKKVMIGLLAFSSLTAFADKPDLIRALGLYDEAYQFGSVMPKAESIDYINLLQKSYLPAGTYTGYIASKKNPCHVEVIANEDKYSAEIFKGSDAESSKTSAPLASVVINGSSPVLNAKIQNGVIGFQIINNKKLRIGFIGVTGKNNLEIAIENWGSASTETSGASTQHCQGLELKRVASENK